MRPAILVYGVLYVVVEMVGHRLRTVGWASVTPLRVASALVDALLAIVLALAVVVAVDLGRRRWGPAVRAWLELRAGRDDGPHDPIVVTSWRPVDEPVELPSTLPTDVRGDRRGPSGSGRPW